MQKFYSLPLERQGEAILLVEVCLWGMFPVFGRAATAYLPPITVIALQTLVAAGVVFLIAVVSGRLKSFIIKGNKRLLLQMGMAVLFNAIGYHVLVLIALSKTTSSNVAILANLEMLFTYLFFTVFLREKHPVAQFVGALIMLFGALLVIGSLDSLSFSSGEMFIIVATVIAPFGNFFQQKIVKQIPAYILLFWRSLIGGAAMCVLALLLEENAFQMEGIGNALPFIIGAGVICLGFSKVLFLEAMKRLSVAKTVALCQAAPAITLFAAHFFLDEEIGISQIFGFILISFGVIVIVSGKRKEGLKNLSGRKILGWKVRV